MVILGLNAYHGDSSAALIVNGQLVAAAEEERFRRIKHWAGFPSESIKYCLEEAELTLSQVDHIAINQDSRANYSRKVLFALKNRLNPKLLLNQLKKRKKRSNIAIELDECFPEDDFGGSLHQIEHHRCHLSSAFHVSPFDKAVAVSIDGFGDFASAAWGLGEGCDISIDDKVLFPHSLGIFYQALTQFLGFPHYGDEYKVMGLAPYGKPAYMAEMQQLVNLLPDGGYELNLDYFIHHKQAVSEGWSGGSPTVVTLYSEKMRSLFGEQRDPGAPLTQVHYDLARSVQAMYEKAFFHLLNSVHSVHQTDSVVIAGGCGMNSVANGKIRQNTAFTNVYVQSAAGDAGGAIGSALSVWHSQGGARTAPMNHSYWGPAFDNASIEQIIESRRGEIDDAGCMVKFIDDEDTLCADVARFISEGRVIGWFQGRMEWGPRALGNRSILGDPRRADMKDILNLKIKRRESFRPFAPSVLRNQVADWFETDADVPFMMQVFKIVESKRSEIPAVAHVDGSGRLQTVKPEDNRRYHRLISKFNDLTGVPMLLNTSFNENEPVVCTPEQALDCFLRTEMDVLAMQDWVIYR